MIFEWDAHKAALNIEVRGISFEYACRVFDDPTHVTYEDNRFSYGEQRLITFGQIEGRLFVVVHTNRDNKVRIISARKANKRERVRFDHAQEQSDHEPKGH